MALDILHDNWGPYTHTEVENALKAYLSNLEQRISDAVHEGGIGLSDLAQEVRVLLTKANTALQPENLASWAKQQNKPGYTVSEITGVEGFQNLLAKLQDMDAKIQAAAASGGVDPDDEMSSTSEKPVQNKVIKDYVDAAVLTLQNALNTLMNGQSVTDAIDTFNEIVDFLDDIDTDDPTLANQLLALNNSITALQTALAGKISGIKTSDNTPLTPDSNGIVTLPPAGSTISPATAAPSMDGNTALVGSSAKYAREDHVHPHDSTKANVSDVYSKTDADTLLAGKQRKLTFDDAPTTGSNNPVKSGGIYDAIAAMLSQVTVNAIPAGSVAVEDNLASSSKVNALSANMGAELYALIQILFQQLNMIDVSEDGLYFIDSNDNIGVCIDGDGLHAINILEHVITG